MRLQPTSFDKKTYLTYLKGYMKKVKAHLAEKDPDRVEAFEKAAQNYAKKIIANFKDWEFYTGDGMDPEAMVVLLNYREDGTTPYLVFFKDGLKEEKVVWNPLFHAVALMKSKHLLCAWLVSLCPSCDPSSSCNSSMSSIAANKNHYLNVSPYAFKCFQWL
jgi:Translationally controlled tumour protein